MTGDACREVGFGAGLLEMTSFGSLCARPIPENGSRICLLTVGDSLTAPNTKRSGSRWAVPVRVAVAVLGC